MLGTYLTKSASFLETLGISKINPAKHLDLGKSNQCSKNSLNDFHQNISFFTF